MKKIAIVGIGGRTGTMFAFELRNSAEILGVGREVEKIKDYNPPTTLPLKRAPGKIFVLRGKEKIKYEGKIISQEEFNEEVAPDFIFLCVKNPVSSAVRYYYQRVKKDYNPPATRGAQTKVWEGGGRVGVPLFGRAPKIPSLILSQNGISAVEDAKKELEEIFGETSKEIRIIRVNLFNPISSEKNNDEVKISYFLPVRLAFGVASGPRETDDLKEIFKKANIEAEEVLSENIKNMEFSKLVTNLIGMAAAARGFEIGEGFEKKEIFEEEIRALKEYIKVVKKSGGKFLNFNHYPIKLLTLLINFLPLPILRIFRKTVAKAITKGRGGKEKGNIDEIEYYNGAVIRLGEKFKVETPINKKIYQTIKEKL